MKWLYPAKFLGKNWKNNEKQETIIQTSQKKISKKYILSNSKPMKIVCEQMEKGNKDNVEKKSSIVKDHNYALDR